MAANAMQITTVIEYIASVELQPPATELSSSSASSPSALRRDLIKSTTSASVASQPWALRKSPSFCALTASTKAT